MISKVLEDLTDIINYFKNTKDEKHAERVTFYTNFYEKRVLQKLAAFIATKRKEKHLTVRELKDRSKVSLAVINDLEKARSMPRIETLIRLGLALEIDFNEVFKALVLPEIKSIKKDGTTDIAMDIAKYGYDKNQILEILDFIKYIDFKAKKDIK